MLPSTFAKNYIHGTESKIMDPVFTFRQVTSQRETTKSQLLPVHVATNHNQTFWVFSIEFLEVALHIVVIRSHSEYNLGF